MYIQDHTRISTLHREKNPRFPGSGPLSAAVFLGYPLEMMERGTSSGQKRS